MEISGNFTGIFHLTIIKVWRSDNTASSRIYTQSSYLELGVFVKQNINIFKSQLLGVPTHIKASHNDSRVNIYWGFSRQWPTLFPLEKWLDIQAHSIFFFRKQLPKCPTPTKKTSSIIHINSAAWLPHSNNVYIWRPFHVQFAWRVCRCENDNVNLSVSAHWSTCNVSWVYPVYWPIHLGLAPAPPQPHLMSVTLKLHYHVKRLDTHRNKNYCRKIKIKKAITSEIQCRHC